MPSTLPLRNATDHRASLLNALSSLTLMPSDAVQDLRLELHSWPTDEALISYLTTHSLASMKHINQAYAEVFHLPFVQLPAVPDATVMRLLPYAVCEQYKIVPIKKTGDVITVAVADPLHIRENQHGVLAQLKHDNHFQFTLVMTSPEEFDRWIAGYPIGVTPIQPPQTPITAPKSVEKSDSISLLGKKIPSQYLTKLPKAIAEYYHFVVFDTEQGGAIGELIYHIAATNPTEPRLLQTIRYIEQANQIHFKVFQTDARSIEYALSLYERDHYLVAGTVSLQGRVIPPELLTKIPYDVANRYRFLVFERHGNDYSVATDTPNDPLLSRIWHYIEEQHHIVLRVYSCDTASFNTVLALYSDAPKQVQNVFVTSPQITVVSQNSSVTSATQTAALAIPQAGAPAPLEEHHASWWEKLLEMFGVKHKELLTISEPLPEIASPIASATLPNASAPLSPQTNSVLVAPNQGTHPPAVPVTTTSKPDPAHPVMHEEGNNHPNDPNTPKDDVYKEVAKASQKPEKDEDDLGSLLEKDVETADELEQIIKEGFIPKIVAAIVSYAITLHASDVHIEAELKDVRIRYRVDGMLQDVARMPLESQAAIVSRIKILSRLKIDETRIPQDGRFDVAFKDREVDLRVSSMPMVHGEKIVMRILDKSHGIMTLEDLGVLGRAFDVIIDAIKKPYGIMLSTGPTGSGKSTTLYAILNRISVPTVNVITLEDPVEYEIGGVNQSQIKPKIGFTFAEGLRSVLRQDPNIIMVGEIRDSETANMATHAALTGHLVLSTLHTNDAPGALPRLMNMGVEPFLITSSINAVEAQRLVRKICPHCKEEIQLPPAVVEEIKAELAKIPENNPKDRARVTPDMHFYHGKGCNKCQNGYRGRIGIYEVMPMSDKIEELAIKKASATDIQKQAILEGMITIKQDGLLKALSGMTTVDEVMRETSV